MRSAQTLYSKCLNKLDNCRGSSRILNTFQGLAPGQKDLGLPFDDVIPDPTVMAANAPAHHAARAGKRSVAGVIRSRRAGARRPERTSRSTAR